MNGATTRPEDDPALRERIKPDVWYHVSYAFLIQAGGEVKLLAETSIEEIAGRPGHA